LLVIAIALAARTGHAEDPKPAAPAADAKPKEAAKPPAKDAAKDAPAPPAKDASGASAEVKAGTGVEKHEIVGEAASFPAGTTVWVWSRVTNAEGTIKHVWKRDGKEVWTATLPVGGKLWSTQSRRTIPAAGSWQVDVQSEAGASLGTVSFTIQ
jgi:hypothetical protein